MTDFILKTAESKDLMETPLQKLNRHISYAKFIKQPLTLGMFVPCDDDGNVLNYVKNETEILQDEQKICRLISKEESRFIKAKSKVLFNGFQVRKQSTYSIVSNKEGYVWVTWNKSKTIESLIPYNLDLTISF